MRKTSDYSGRGGYKLNAKHLFNTYYYMLD
jgi:hypothetical protein